eukprot:COSAG01_NODE_60482_length_294_cov_1.317949_1_plen_21_part_01
MKTVVIRTTIDPDTYPPYRYL